MNKILILILTFSLFFSCSNKNKSRSLSENKTYRTNNVKNIISFNGQDVSEEKAKKISEFQYSLSNSVMDKIDQAFQNGFYNPKIIKSDFLKISEDIFLFSDKYIASFDKINNKYIDNFQKNEYNLYKSAYENQNLNDAERMAIEYLIGLSRFQIAAKISEKFANNYGIYYSKAIKSKELSKINFLDRISYLANVIKEVDSKIGEKFKNEKEDHWKNVYKFYKKYPNLKKLALNLTGMHFVNNKNYSAINYAGQMQYIHLYEIGEDGYTMKPLMEKYKQIENLMSLSFENHTDIIKSKKDIPFKKSIEKFKKDTNELMDQILQNVKENQSIKILHIGSNPFYNDFNDFLKNLNNRKIKTKIYASDINGSNLLKLRKLKDLKKIDRIFFEDLNLINNEYIEKKSWMTDKLDLFSTSMVLHQIPLENIIKTLQYANMMTKPGGIIINPDLTFEGVYGQIPGGFLEINTINRKGFVQSIFNHNFEKTSFINENLPCYKKIIVPFPAPYIKQDLYQLNLYTTMYATNSQIKNLQKIYKKAIRKKEYKNYYELVSKIYYSNKINSKISSAIKAI